MQGSQYETTLTAYVLVDEVSGQRISAELSVVVSYTYDGPNFKVV